MARLRGRGTVPGDAEGEHELLGESLAVRDLRRLLAKLAPTDSPVLIRGESGTGKELVARTLHRQSRRADRPFVAINCGAIPEHLIQSELFGHEKGAFTGAHQRKVGRIEAADGGTLFLDEIGDLPPSIQVKLLRVLQEREVVRLGSRRPIPIDVRLVAATNVDLADAVVAGHFREDLFYRLHVATIQLPPLRERRGDILPLAEYFIVEHCRRLGYTSASLSPEAERKLLGHSWAGNIRELENAIHHALLVCRNRLIQPADLHLIDMRARQEPNGLRRAPESAAGSALEAALQALFEENREDLYEHIEETVFRAAYRFCHGNQLQTGRLLGISRNIVRARLEKIGELETSPRHNVVSLVGK
nr:sigma-54 dependent transcriptional regulator [Pseudomonas aeruginosa]